MNNFKSHFDIHLRFRNGIFILAILLSIIVFGFYFYPSSVDKRFSFTEVSTFQVKIDSLRRVEGSIKEKKVLPFNPNFISDFKGYQLGLLPEELDRITEHRNQNKWINSVSDFKRVTRISDTLLDKISPLFKFPNKLKYQYSKKRFKAKKYPYRSFDEKLDLNTVTAAELVEKIKLPDFIAKRIIRYREKINGFVHDIQLKDIYGLYTNQRLKIESLFTVKTSNHISKININKASVNDLVEVPYFDFETVLEIRDFIKVNGPITSFKELRKIEGFSLEKIDRIALYLTLN